MDDESTRPAYLYRGTTSGWPGNPSCEFENRTCTTTDPLVATLFAVQCRNFGFSVVHVFKVPDDLLLESGNGCNESENEVVVPMHPIQFASAAERTIEVERALQALAVLGIECPHRISPVAERLTRYVEFETRRLAPEEVREFNRLCGVSDNE
jgi:hypothetical protein